MIARRFVLLTAPILALVAPALADEIQLKASVRLPAGADAVRLADIAVLQGPEAARYADLVIDEPSASGELMEIPISQIREALDDAGAHWGRINLSGRKVIIRPRRAAQGDSPGAMTAVSLGGTTERTRAAPRPPKTDDRPASELLDQTTLRGEIARHVRDGLDADPAALRIGFALVDDAWLDRSLREMRFELKPESSVTSDRVTFTVRAWSGGRVAESRQITVQPLVEVSTAVLQRDVRRGEMLASGDFRNVLQWLPPRTAELCADPARAAGCIAARTFNAGDVLREIHLQRQTLIQRGDRVAVRCLVGGVVISLTAEARADGAEGETIALRKLGERREFTATVTGPGEAVVDLQGGAR